MTWSKTSASRQQGFSLIELMISLALGLAISTAVIQVLLSSHSTERLNRALASVQENGRFIISRLRNDILMAGRYDPMLPALNKDLDVIVEGAFVQNNPVPVVGDFAAAPAKGSIEGAGANSDTLMLALQASKDCRGFKLGYLAAEEFFVVNEYFLEGTTLKCRGFDGRVLQGQKAAEDNDGDTAYTLLDGVHSFQVVYGITDNSAAQDNSALPVKFINGTNLGAEKLAGSQVVAIRIAILLKADANVLISPMPAFKLVDEDPVTPSESRLFKQFETTITLRNSKNFIRSRNI